MIVTHFHCYVNYDSLFLLCCKCSFNPNILETIQRKLLKFFKDREANDRGKNFPKMQKF